MSVTQYQRNVNSLDQEIAGLEKKKSEKDIVIATLQGKITALNKRMTGSMSPALRKNKLRQISIWEEDVARKSKESADLSTKIADRRKKRAAAYIKLQKAQQDEQKKSEKQTMTTMKKYEERIDQLQKQLIEQMIPNPVRNANQKDEEYDVFVSHAWEDKKEFVDELVSEMRKLGLKVWYDTDKLKWGDSMREKIDKGLSKSRYGIVVLSPEYIREDKYWTKAELNGLFQKETINGKTILPIWHNLTKQQVTEYSPLIADRKALTTALMTSAEMAAELNALFSHVEEEVDGQTENADAEQG